MTRRELVESNEFWLCEIQLQLFDKLDRLMKEQNLTKDEVAHRFGIPMRKVSEILNGNFNGCLESFVDICVKMGFGPQVELKDLKDVE